MSGGYEKSAAQALSRHRAGKPPLTLDDAVLDDVKPRRTRLRRFMSWHRDEKFWRDVYARAVATVVGAAVTYLLALASGVIHTPPRYLYWSLDYFILAASIAVIVAHVVMYRWKRRVPHRYRLLVEVSMYLLSAAALLFGTLDVLGLWVRGG